MTRTEEVDAAIERLRALPDFDTPGPVADSRLLAEEVTLLREAVRGLRDELDLAIAEVTRCRATVATPDRNTPVS